MSEPWFSLVCTGRKKFEGRLASNRDFGAAEVGSVVTWFNDDLPHQRVCRVKITKKTRYGSFRDMMSDVGVGAVLPTVENVARGVAVYRQFYPESAEKRSGVLCIRMKVLSPTSGT